VSDWSGYHVSAFVLQVRDGMTDEYRRRHAAIWPELAAALKAQGIVHYDLFLDEAGRRVFGHQLRSRPADPGAPKTRRSCAGGPTWPTSSKWMATGHGARPSNTSFTKPPEATDVRDQLPNPGNRRRPT
jgi:hypothetical protein